MADRTAAGLRAQLVAALDLHEAGWVEQHEDAVSWQLTDAGRAVLDAYAFTIGA